MSKRKGKVVFTFLFRGGAIKPSQFSRLGVERDRETETEFGRISGLTNHYFLPRGVVDGNGSKLSVQGGWKSLHSVLTLLIVLNFNIDFFIIASRIVAILKSGLGKKFLFQKDSSFREINAFAKNKFMRNLYLLV